MVDIPIAREGITEKHFIVTTRRMFVESQTFDTKLQLLRKWMQALKAPSLDELAAETDQVKQFAQLLPFVLKRDDLMLCKR